MSFMNLLFIRYLQKLIIQAQNEGKNSMANNYKKAMNSIKKYPLPLRSGLEAKNLIGVGELIANKLESLQQTYKNKLPIESMQQDSDKQNKAKRNSVGNAGSDKHKKYRISSEDNILRERPISFAENAGIREIASPSPKKQSNVATRKEIRKRKIVTPKKKKTTTTTTTKTSEKNKASEDDSKPRNKNIDTIINNGHSTSQNLSISLISPELERRENGDVNNNVKKRKKRDEEDEDEGSKKTTNRKSSRKKVEGIPSIFTPEKNTRALKDKIVLLLDNRENNSMKAKDVLEKFKNKRIECQVRTLNVGDMMWVVQKENGEEKVLNWIAERKTTGDLSQSIIDRRYKEQKFRIKKCGISNIFYIIEGSVANWDNKSRGHGVCSNTLESALFSSSHGTHDFIIHNSKNMDDTINYLANLTHQITRQYRKSLEDPHIKPVTNFSFEQFNSSNDKSKNLTIKDVFGKQLMQIKGISGEKANLICSLYPTPISLYNAYLSKKSKKDKENLISEMKSNGRRMISVSKNIYNFYN